MLTLRRNHSESGFMSVESIANALFYLIMIAVVTLVASKVMHSGKIATTVTALSMLRSNIQYVGVNAGEYTEVGDLVLEELIPGIIKTGGVLPTGQVLSVDVAAAGDPDEMGQALAGTEASYFKMVIVQPSAADCRKLAYYGLGAGYGVATATNGTGAIAQLIDVTTAVADVEGACNGTDDLILTSR